MRLVIPLATLKKSGNGDKYKNPDGTFKGGWEGCMAYFQNEKGLSKESATKMCGYIKARKGG